MPPDTRQSMVLAAVELLRERGVDGVTLDDVLSRSGAPRGSIYHHFPAGRAQIIDEAAQLSGDAISRLISNAAPGGPAAIVDAFTAFWRKLLQQSDFAAGCPVVSIAVSAVPGSALAQHANQIFRTWHQLVTDCLVADGLDTAVARRLATMSLGAIEGAITMCRATSSLQPLDDVNAELKLLLAARSLFAADSRTPKGS
ncbi:TetR/AcrR family transcriptional regulator [Mycolicibacterium mucogenicum]|uniref:TetR/AcrR family transcriptional regulator n=1 Tax=Mycolicibacterium mucogenicum DSM 44124 TaxID=1226753 RepID=A0A8H2PH45_MYCMU|nr:TetR/AcrR family transcriptional regulator [Mycolicibacterium mucogenicum]KAB7755097.1 TetR family transcriptional regulator [Mycolicibacterium mucogenicum DSM 44124]QPG71954.1 TetR/AcrR family transcriptional regulator [Mycolicibacterium mucogenicum DSM 44124]